MKFIMAYSGGKDCTLALDKMLRQGHTCEALLVSTGEKGIWSYMHVFHKDVLSQFSESLQIPMIISNSKDKHDVPVLLKALNEAKEKYHIEALCTGDIDIPEVKQFNENIASEAGIKAVFPIWQKDRYECLNEFWNLGYTCRIKAVDTRYLPESYLGKQLDKSLVSDFEKLGIDICGEFGEYHTMVNNGPIFTKEIPFSFNRIYRNGNNSYLI